jgi:outer membrane protein OmpA-like peptidoglycan-associated protein
MPLRRVLPLLALPALLLSSAPARAADCSPASRVSSCLDADNLWLRPGPSLFSSIGNTALTPAGQIGFGFVVGYQRRPIVFRLPSAEPGGTDAYAIDDQLNASLLWTVGLSRFLELTAVAPVALYQNGVGVSPLVNQQSTPVTRSAIRDTRVGLNAGILRREGGYLQPGPGLAARLAVVLPTGDQTTFAGGKGVGAAPSLVFDYRIGPVVVGVEAGARLRSSVEIAGATIGNRAYEALGVSVDVLSNERLTVGAEIFSLQSLGTQQHITRAADGSVIDGTSRPANLPTEWLFSLRSAPALAGDLSFHLGGGTSIPLTDNTVTAPAFRVLGGVRYAPLGRDSDGDGILDKNDKCPFEAEDFDGFEDDDGCPDPDNDRDGIPDSKDKCRDAPEDFDGFQDEDGCPDLDDDNDGIPDVDDKCRNEPEDKDGFQDEDGCPDPDNDGDGIPDAKDMCPNGPEDFDGFRDEDGCPDPDNDGDGIPDAKDMCPNEPEDFDGFQDEDGCPDPDNDNDGILDKADRCPNEPETINGIEDEDGCPESGARDMVGIQGSRIEVTPPVRFAAGKAKVTAEMEKSLRMVAQKARGAPRFERLVVEAYGDGPTPVARQEDLASKRAEAIRAVLLTAGISADSLTVAMGDIAAKRPAKAPHADFQIVLKKRK